MIEMNKKSLINLLIDSPLRGVIKINLIDIVNNTSEEDINKVLSTITKELDVFQQATERRLKLAKEIKEKLSKGDFNKNEDDDSSDENDFVDNDD